MSYWDVSLIAHDNDIQTRITAAAATEHQPGSPEQWAFDHRWDTASQPGWGDAWASALAAGNQAPGRDPAVITDGQILSAVQSIGAGAG